MTKTVTAAITGANSYTGRYISKILLASTDTNFKIRNLTNSPNRKHDLGEKAFETMPLAYHDTSQMAKILEGTDVLFNTYWVRYNDYKGITREQSIQNSKNIVDAAKMAGVKKIVYSSHTQTSLDSPLQYIRGKAEVEQYIRESGLEYGFVKPCCIFGDTPDESIVINNISYFMRTFPVFPVSGDASSYHLQPVHVRDLAELMVDCATDPAKTSHEVDAVGHKFTVNELLTTIKDTLGLRRLIVNHVPIDVCYYGTKPIDLIFNDKFIERDDLLLMSSGITCSLEPPTGKRKLTDFLEKYKDTIGRRYISSNARYYK